MLITQDQVYGWNRNMSTKRVILTKAIQDCVTNWGRHFHCSTQPLALQLLNLQLENVIIHTDDILQMCLSSLAR